MIKTWLLAADGSVGSNIMAVVPIVVGVLVVCFIIGIIKGAKNKKKKAKNEMEEVYESILNSKVTFINFKDTQWNDDEELLTRLVPVATFSSGVEDTLLIEEQIIKKETMFSGSSYYIRFKHDFVEGKYDKDLKGEPIVNTMKVDVKAAFIDRYYAEIIPPCETTSTNIKDLVLKDKFVFPDEWHEFKQNKDKNVSKIFSVGHFEGNGELYYVAHQVQIEFETGNIYKDYVVCKVRDGKELFKSLIKCDPKETAELVTKYKLYDLR